MCLEIRRALLREGAGGEASEYSVGAHPEVVRLLSGELRGILVEPRERHGLTVRTFEAPDFHPARFEIDQAPGREGVENLQDGPRARLC